MDCPICLTELHLTTGETSPNSAHHHDGEPPTQTNRQQPSARNLGQTNSKLNRKQQDRKLLEKLSQNSRNSLSERQVASDSDCRHDSENSKENASLESSGAKRDKTSDNLEGSPSQAGENRQKKKASAGSMFVTQSKRELEAPSVSGPRRIRATVLLSCTHVFHSTCLRTLEEMAMVDMRNTCPVCRAHYQKKVINF